MLESLDAFFGYIDRTPLYKILLICGIVSGITDIILYTHHQHVNRFDICIVICCFVFGICGYIKNKI